MRCYEIMRLLEQLSPKGYALEWDNVGLLVGDPNQEIQKILITLDVTEKTVDQAIAMKADMIVSHHPMIFSKMKKVTADNVLGRKILKLSKYDICCYAMHTNFDVKGGMSELMAERVGLRDGEILERTTDTEGIGRVGVFHKASGECYTVQELSEYIKLCFGLPFVFVYGDLDRKVERVALSPGSGKSMVGPALFSHADCLISGDFGHHEGLDAVEAGLSVIDATHAGVERIFIDYIYGYLKSELMKADNQKEVIVEKVRLEDTIPVRVV